MAKRIPTPRYMAASLLRNFEEPAYFRSADELTTLFESRVSEAKRDKVMKEVEKFAAGLKRRLKKVIDRFENPPPKHQKEKP